ncbi:MAG: hypothetical protein GY703_02880 [Gammaproteobacteria bacterium]|nr:hypothetical protein [Gammaproteobacteria bacterium]
MNPKNLVALLLLLSISFSAQAIQPLVDAKWLAASLGKANLVVLDLQPAAAYQRFHMPGAVNLPFDWLTVNGGARFHSQENLRRIYQVAGVPAGGEQISFCHTGHRTSLAWFVSHELLGNRETRLYDGSTAEWLASRVFPVEQKIKLD